MSYGEIEKSLIALLESSVLAVLSELGLQTPLPREIKIELEIPKDKSHGDISSNAALKISKLTSKSPLELAALLTAKLKSAISASPIGNIIERIEIKNPGFVNFFVSKEHLFGVLLDIEKMGEDFGRSDSGAGVKLQIEFVSANPTGPLTIAHGRQAALGDSLANIMSFLGYDVTKEYYLNDEGNQMNMLGRSIRA